MRIFSRPRRPLSTRSSVIILIGVVGVALVLGVVRLFRDVAPKSHVQTTLWEELTANDEPQAANEVTDTEPVPTTDEQPELPTTPTPTQAPPSFNLALPFTSQAPTGNWDAIHEDTCEEASVYMVVKYFSGSPAGVIDPTTADGVMLDMVGYEEGWGNYDDAGYGPSVSAEELSEIIDVFFNHAYTVDIIDNPTADDIKAFIADGYPVIVPAAGRMLGNPFFTGEGPLYHMLVVRGYEDGRFITNDPGTRHGENYTYAEDVLMSAIHDWNSGDPVNGTPRVLVMTPAR